MQVLIHFKRSSFFPISSFIRVPYKFKKMISVTSLPSISLCPNQNHLQISRSQNFNSMRELKQIHSQLIRTGRIHDPQEQSRLMAFCCTHVTGSMGYARHLFDQIPEPNIFIFNTMIRGYSMNNSPEAAASVYIEMLVRGIHPDCYTFPFVLKAFTREIGFKCGEEFHAHIIKFGFNSNVFAQNALIHMYALCGRIVHARHLFDKSSKQDVVTWNAMISGYNRSKRFEESCRLFGEMEKANVVPTPVTLVSVLSACTKLKDLSFGQWIHQYIENNRIEPNLILGNALIDMYAACGDMDAALGLFDSMEVKDIISWTAMVAGYANLGQVDQARMLFDWMPKRDFISWTAMIDGYLRSNRFKEALEIFRDMQVAKIRPDEFTMVSILTACAHLGALEMGEWVRVYIDKSKIKTDVCVGNALLDMYAKCGNIESAVEIFEKMTQRDKFTWTALIVGLAVNGYGEEALDIFNKMLQAGITPDEVTYVGVLTACAHAGMVDKGREVFSAMITCHGIVPNVAHYGCMVDLLGRSGHLKEALEIISNMPMKPNSTVWGAFLGACRVHKSVELAETAAKSLLDLEPENGAVYVLLANIYAACSRWEDVRRIRKLMTENGIKKTPGCSLIEMNGAVHEFVAGDRSHPQSNEIYSKLDGMAKDLKLAGYIPDTSEVLIDIAGEEKENAVYWHSEKLAIAFGLISSQTGATIRVVKNLRMCVDCHRATKIISKIYEQEVIIRDRTRFHHFKNGSCSSCKDYW